MLQTGFFAIEPSEWEKVHSFLLVNHPKVLGRLIVSRETIEGQTVFQYAILREVDTNLWMLMERGPLQVVGHSPYLQYIWRLNAEGLEEVILEKLDGIRINTALGEVWRERLFFHQP